MRSATTRSAFALRDDSCDYGVRLVGRMATAPQNDAQCDHWVLQQWCGGRWETITNPWPRRLRNRDLPGWVADKPHLRVIPATRHSPREGKVKVGAGEYRIGGMRCIVQAAGPGRWKVIPDKGAVCVYDTDALAYSIAHGDL